MRKPKSIIPEDRTKPDLKPTQHIQTSQQPKLDEKPKEITKEETKLKTEKKNKRGRLLKP